MKGFEVYGLALSTVEVIITVEAESEQDAKNKALELFNQGQHGDVRYACDDAATTDFQPFGASEVDIYETA